MKTQLYLCIHPSSCLSWLHTVHVGAGHESVSRAGLRCFLLVQLAPCDLLSFPIHNFKQTPQRNKYPYLDSWAAGGSYQIHEEYSFSSDTVADFGWSRQVSLTQEPKNWGKELLLPAHCGLPFACGVKSPLLKLQNPGFGFWKGYHGDTQRCKCWVPETTERLTIGDTHRRWVEKECSLFLTRREDIDVTGVICPRWFSTLGTGWGGRCP